QWTDRRPPESPWKRRRREEPGRRADVVVAPQVRSYGLVVGLDPGCIGRHVVAVEPNQFGDATLLVVVPVAVGGRQSEPGPLRGGAEGLCRGDVDPSEQLRLVDSKRSSGLGV